jgi:putative RNA 2'-phosphotransferase
MDRHHVHLSPDEETARRVGNRRGPAVLLRIDAAALHQAGGVFYQSGNGVWLTAAVPPEFIRELGA